MVAAPNVLRCISICGSSWLLWTPVEVGASAASSGSLACRMSPKPMALSRIRNCKWIPRKCVGRPKMILPDACALHSLTPHVTARQRGSANFLVEKQLQQKLMFHVVGALTSECSGRVTNQTQRDKLT